jgi:RNA polymerase sigma factor (sigma-70 family)
MDNHSLRAVLRYFQTTHGQDTSRAGDHDLLCDLVSRRDERAFAALMQRHGPMVLGVCRRVLHNEFDAEDAFQATFLVLARRAGTIRRGESLHGWLYQVAFRVAQRLRLRVSRRQTAAIPEELANPRDEPDALSWQEVRSALDEELQQLPEKYRAPLLLCCVSGKTRDEAAEELGWTLNVLKGRLERGRKLLKARLLRRGVELSAALLALTLSQSKSSAALPATLTATTLKAVSVAFGSAAGTIPAEMLQLAECGIRATGISPLKWAVTTALVMCLAALGAGAVWTAGFRSPAAQSAAHGNAGDDRTTSDQGGRAGARDLPFVDVTRESGLETILDEKYAATPKWWLSGLHLVDLDGDGHLDVFLSAPGLLNSGAVAALNDGKGHFTRAQGTFPPTELRLAYDLDEDGKVDLGITFQDGGSQWWLNKSTPGTLRFEPTAIKRGANTARRQAMIDLDRDGKVDWLRGVPDGLAFDLADGRGGFTAGAGQLPVGDTEKAETLCLPVDLDGDGYIDLVVEWGHFRNGKGISRIYRNDGKMNFKDVTEESGLSGKDLAIKGVADVNQDGFPDLIVLENLKPEIYLNDGKGKFTKLPNAISGMDSATPPSMASWGVAVMTDFDNDGVPDLLWNGKHFLWVLRGTGGGKFRYVNREWGIKDLSVASVDDGHCFGDINGDGLLDILGYTSDGEQHRFAVYQNNLPRDNHWLRVRPVGAPGNRGAAGAKIRLYDPQTRKLLWYEQVAIYSSQSAQSYYSHGETERHYGLGSRPAVDVEVEFYPSGKKVEKKGVKADATVSILEK